MLMNEEKISRKRKDESLMEQVKDIENTIPIPPKPRVIISIF